MEVFRIYKTVNYADTTRDADDIETTELGLMADEKEAVEIAKTYIKHNFAVRNTKLNKYKNGFYTATDFCSYGATICIEKLELIWKS
jgi:hypothetical protein